MAAVKEDYEVIKAVRDQMFFHKAFVIVGVKQLLSIRLFGNTCPL